MRRRVLPMLRMSVLMSMVALIRGALCASWR